MRKRLAAIAAVVLLVALSVPPAAHAAGEDRARLVLEFGVDPESAGLLSSATARDTVTGETVMPFVDPPLGGCNWSDVGGNITANYVNGFLSDLTANYSGNTDCLTTAQGQSMDHMSTVANLIKDTQNIDQGTVDDCEYTPANACTFVLSLGTHVCAGGAWSAKASIR